MRRRARFFRNDWLLGFFGFFSLYAIPGLLDGEWIWASWLAWAVWFLFFLPPEDGQPSAKEEGANRSV